MKFEEFLQNAWNDHGPNATTVAKSFSEGRRLLERPEQIAPFTQLVAHVFGEHLGKWREGEAFLASLRALPIFSAGSEADHAVTRAIAALRLAGGHEVDLAGFSPSDQIRVRASAAAALAGQMEFARATELFREALVRAQTGLPASDPANRALAVTGNNLAAALEESPSRTDEGTQLMVLAAETGRRYWEIAGGWIEVSRAEYRLAQTFLQVPDLARAFAHAQSCVEICEANGAGDLDLFFAYEVLAVSERARGNSLGFDTARKRAGEAFAKLGAEDRAWCEASWRKLG